MAEGGVYRNFGSRCRFLSRSRSISSGRSGSFSKGLKVGAGGGGGCYRNFGSRCRFLGWNRSIRSRRDWIVLKRVEGGSRRRRGGATGISGAGAGSWVGTGVSAAGGIGRFQRGRRWEQEAEEGVHRNFGEKKFLGYQEYYLLDSIHLPQQLYYL